VIASWYGDHQWRVQVFSDYSAAIRITIMIIITSIILELNILGRTFDDTTLHCKSVDHWPVSSNPSTATGYYGCNVTDDYFHFNALRQGFDGGIYQINVPSHDEYAYLYINGVNVWHHEGCCDSHSNVWDWFTECRF